jgi:hypothetical protein
MTAFVWGGEADDGRQSARQSSAPVGMSFAVNSAVRFDSGRGEEIWVREPVTVAGIDDADRAVLSDWLARAGVRGIDTVMDLSVRPWKIAGPKVIFGVFEAGKSQASWLVVRYGSGWTLARCVDGFVWDASASLPDILALIDEDVNT